MLLCWQMAFAHPVDKDVMLNLLRGEVGYYYSRLSADTVPLNYLSLNVMDEHHLVLTSDMGYASVREGRTRKLSPVIRIGDWQKFGQINPFRLSEEGYTNFSLGSYDLPLADDTVAIKEVIWNALRRKYAGSLDVYWLLSSGNKNDSLPAQPALEPEEYYEAPLPGLLSGREEWTELLNRITQSRGIDSLALCKATLDAQLQRHYIVNSEGKSIVQNRRTYLIGLSATVNDEQGTPCEVTQTYFAYDESELPKEDALREAMDDLSARARALSRAPMAEAYSGPVLFSGSASGVFFHEVFGHRIEKEDSEFKSLMGTTILPADFNIACDPTIDRWDGTPLSGSYRYDDEGTLGERVVCLENGVMNSMLTCQTTGNQSNGHGRADFGNDATPRQSNLIIETSQPLTEQQLRAMLVEDLKKNNKEYGYYVYTVSNGWTVNGTRQRVASFNVVPIETYRVYADGRPDELVRGVTFIGTPLNAFSNIQAAGGRSEVFNGKCGSQSGWIPVSCISPMMYVSQIETQCANVGKRVSHVLSSPEVVAKEQLCGMNSDDVIFKAMEDEMQHSMDSLRQPDGSAPFFLDYNIRRTASSHIESSLGSCRRFDSDGIRNSGIISVIAGDEMNTSYNLFNLGTEFQLPDELSYNHIRRELWSRTDRQFRNAVENYTGRERRAKEFIDQGLPEWPRLPARDIREESALGNCHGDADSLRVIADRMSAVFRKYPELLDTHVSIDQKYSDTYRMTSDGLRLRKPQKEISITAYAYVRTPDGKLLRETSYMKAYDLADLPTLNSLISDMENFAQHTIQLGQDSEAEEREYVGPVMLEDNAVSNALLLDGAMKRDIGSHIHSFLKLSSREYDNSYRNLGKKVVSKNISVWQLGNDSVYQGHRLLRYQKYDADGVQSFTQELIRRGVLVNQLAGRIPSPKTPTSTGNEYFEEDFRRSLGTHPTRYGHGVLRISFEKTMTHKKLIRKLIKMAKEQGLDYAYILKSMGHIVQVNVKTGKMKELRSKGNCAPSRLELMEDIIASSEEWANLPESIIHPQAILLPIAELKIESPEYKSLSENFMELRH